MPLKAILGKNSVQSSLAIYWSVFASIYLAAITFYPIPLNNTRIVDTVLGFLMGTIISGIVGYYFGSSKSSADKNELIKNLPEENKTETKIIETKPIDENAT